MLRRLIILDAVLIVLVVMGCVKFYQDWTAFDPLHDVAAIQPEADSFPALPMSNTSTNTAATDWTEIPMRNPFSFDRNDIAIVAPTATVASGPKPVLFGILSLGGPRMAMLAPGQPAGNRNHSPKQMGETIDGWTVVQIDTKSIVVESNGVRETILMNDPTAQIPRDSTRTASVGASPVVVQSATPATSVTSSSAGATTTPPPANAAPGQPRTRVIQTPFGTVRQTIQEEP